MNNRSRKRCPILIWTAVIFFGLFAFICKSPGHTGPLSDTATPKVHLFDMEQIDLGNPVACVQTVQRHMKLTNEHLWYTITLQGVAVKKNHPALYIQIEKIAVMNLKKEGDAWIKDRTVVKKPPYSIGVTYPFRARHECFDNEVSEGEYSVYFVAP